MDNDIIGRFRGDCDIKLAAKPGFQLNKLRFVAPYTQDLLVNWALERKARLMTDLSRRMILTLAAGVASSAAFASADAFRFPSIDGGEYVMQDWVGRPVLVVNTASLCAFTGQYEGLQALQDRYVDQGLVVLAVPSNDFRQELGSEAEVKEFCEMTFGLDLPMTEITSVRGPQAHPFYAWLRDSHGFTPRWNFNKVLIGPDGRFVDAFGSNVRPDARKLTQAIEAQLSS